MNRHKRQKKVMLAYIRYVVVFKSVVLTGAIHSIHHEIERSSKPGCIKLVKPVAPSRFRGSVRGCRNHPSVAGGGKCRNHGASRVKSYTLSHETWSGKTSHGVKRSLGWEMAACEIQIPPVVPFTCTAAV